MQSQQVSNSEILIQGRECKSLPIATAKAYKAFMGLASAPYNGGSAILFCASSDHWKGRSLRVICSTLQRSMSQLFAAYSQHIATAAISSFWQPLPSLIEVLTEEPTVTNHLSAGGHTGWHWKRLRGPPSENRGRSSDWSWGDHPGQYQSGQGGHGRCRLARVERCAFEEVSPSNYSRSTTLHDGAV
jgi:hypothetical protein